MTRTKMVGALLTLMIFFATVSQARVATGVLEGVVIDSSGKPVPGASVTIQTSDGNHPHATHTDADGRFSFTHFAAGQYDVRASRLGSYSDWTKRVMIHSNKRASVTLRLQRVKR